MLANSSMKMINLQMKLLPQ